MSVLVGFGRTPLRSWRTIRLCGSPRTARLDRDFRNPSPVSTLICVEFESEGEMGDEESADDRPYTFQCAKCGWETTADRRPVACAVCGGRMLAMPPK